eukprot:SAG11_NODE_21389_length_426_cov_0.785933_1_plen_67_part_10
MPSVSSQGSSDAGSQHSSVASAARVYGHRLRPRGLEVHQPLGLDSGSEERARRISVEFWKWAGAADS